MKLIKHRSNCHESYKILSWFYNKRFNLKLDNSCKKYVLWDSEKIDIENDIEIYSPFFVGSVNKNNIDLNLISSNFHYYVLVFDSFREISEFKKSEEWKSFKDKDFCKIRRIFICQKNCDDYKDDINILKSCKVDVSTCGYSLLEILSNALTNGDKEIKSVLKSKKEIKRLIESGAVKVRENEDWIKKEKSEEYFAPHREIIFKIGKTTFFKIK